MVVSPVGSPVSELDTPALVVDLDALDRNTARIVELANEFGVGWRPHAKAHKSPAIAHRLLLAGAIGITVAKLGEAEVYAAAGIRDILIANQIVGPIKTRRLAALARETDVISTVDSVAGVEQLNRAAVAAGSQPRVVIELDCGMGRAGVTPGTPAVQLAKTIVGQENLRFAGLMAWEGHTLDIADPAARAEAIRSALGEVTGTADAIRDAGIPVSIVSVGGTGTFMTARSVTGVTELQAGGGIFGDTIYRALGVPVLPALSMIVTVTSRPTPDRIIVDSGRKSVDPTAFSPTVAGIAGVQGIRLSAEHGTITLAEPSTLPEVGERLVLQIGYSDQAVHLHEQIHAVRDDTVVAVWPTLARGKLT